MRIKTMNKYLMTVTETVVYQCYIYAENKSQAYDEVAEISVMDMYDNVHRCNTDVECEEVDINMNREEIPSFDTHCS